MKLSMPSLAKHADSLYARQKGEQSVNTDNWELKESLGDGSSITYGNKNGEFYAYGTQGDLSAFAQLAREKRFEEASNPKAFHGMGIVKYHIPKILEIEFMARFGAMEYQAMIAQNDMSEIDYVIETEYPELKHTNLSLIKRKSK